MEDGKDPLDDGKVLIEGCKLHDVGRIKLHLMSFAEFYKIL
jgi:hypothetical protein